MSEFTETDRGCALYSHGKPAIGTQRVPGLGRAMTLALTTCSTEEKMDNIAYTVTVLTLPRLQPTLPADYFLLHSSASLQPLLSQPSASHQPAFSHPSASLQPALSQPTAGLSRLQPSPTYSSTKTAARFKIQREIRDSAARFKIQPQDSRSSRKI